MRTGRLLSATLFFMLLATHANAQDFTDGGTPLQYMDSRGISADQAVDMAQRRYGARAVKVETMEQGDRRVYKIRLLSSDGKVWNVRVDAQTGAMD